jgi:hypothetical protein
MAAYFPIFEFGLESGVILALLAFGLGFVFFELDDLELGDGSFNGEGFMMEFETTEETDAAEFILVVIGWTVSELGAFVMGSGLSMNVFAFEDDFSEGLAIHDERKGKLITYWFNIFI